MEGCCGNTSGERGKERSRPRLASIMDACLCLASPSRCPALSTTQPTHNSRCLAACLPARFQGPSPPPGRDGFDWSGTDDGFVADRTVRNPLPPVRVGGDRERQGSRDRWTGIPQYRDRWICRCLGTGLMEQLHYKKRKQAAAFMPAGQSAKHLRLLTLSPLGACLGRPNRAKSPFHRASMKREDARLCFQSCMLGTKQAERFRPKQ